MATSKAIAFGMVTPRSWRAAACSRAEARDIAGSMPTTARVMKALGIFGALLTSTFSVSVVLGQAYLPRNAGMASGLMVGLAMGTGGVAVTFLGWLADRWGVPAALWVSALLPITGLVAAQFLPAPRDREVVAA